MTKNNLKKYKLNILSLQSEPIQFTENIRPVCLPEIPFSHLNDSMITVAGWGLTQETSQQASDILKQTNLKYYSNK